MDLYENNYYKHERIKKQTVSIMIPKHVVVENLPCSLQESLILDSKTEVYLDSVISGYGTNAGTDGADFIAIRIDELECKNIGATLDIQGKDPTNATVNHTDDNKRNNLRNALHNSILIPNTRTSNTYAVNHRSNKYNYISTLNPKKIDKLTISLGFMKTDGLANPGDTGDEDQYTIKYDETRTGHTLLNLVFISYDK